MPTSEGKESKFYYLVLLDFGLILTPTQLKNFTKDIISSAPGTTDSWEVEELSWPNLTNEIKNFTMGYYHSRLIFEGTLQSVPPRIFEIRELRTKLEDEIKAFLNNQIIPAMNKYSKNPRVFIYPVFEISVEEKFWNFKKDKVYSVPTTCFYTELDDPKPGRLNFLINIFRPNKVKVRVSGAKIITSEMSEWFFWNLTNIVFHEGLYRQSRDKKLSKQINAGLENRLEDFASNLMTSFYQLSNTRIQDLVARLIVALTIIGVAVAIAQFAFPIIPHFWHSSGSSANSTVVNQALIRFRLLFGPSNAR